VDVIHFFQTSKHNPQTIAMNASATHQTVLSLFLALSTAFTLGPLNSAEGPTESDGGDAKPAVFPLKEFLLHQDIFYHQISASSLPENEVLSVFVVYALEDVGKEPIFKLILRKQIRTSPHGVATLMTSPVFNLDGQQALTSVSLQIRDPGGRLVNSARKMFTKRVHIRGTYAARKFPQYDAGCTFLSLEIWESPESKEPLKAVGIFCADGKSATQLSSTLPRSFERTDPPKPTKADGK